MKQDTSNKVAALLDDMHTFVALLDLEGNILFVNNLPLQISELKLDDIRGQHFSNASWWSYDINNKALIQDGIERALQGEVINYDIEIEIRNQQRIWITFSLHGVYDSEGKIDYIVAEGIDISRQKQAYEALLKQSRKAQLGEMISIIAHQWRQPLSYISAIISGLTLEGMISGLNNKNTLDELEKINKSIQHLSTTMNQFTSFFDPNKIPKETSFKSIIERTLEVVQPILHENQVAFNFELEEDTAFMSFENEIIQVLIDLIKNANDFFIENKIEKPQLTLTQYCSDTSTILSVSDNAGGIKDDVLPKLFDPYFSTKEKESGGLGLHMSKMIIEEHCNGTISANQIKNGAQFIIKIPLRRES